MRKAIFYYSLTGNTEIVARSIQKKYPDFVLIDMRDPQGESPADYDIIGFAFSTWNLDIPPFFKDYIERLNVVQNVPAFLILTYSVMEGRALKNAGNLIEDKGFIVFDYESIKMPDSFPPFRKKGIENDHFPEEKEVLSFSSFLDRLEESDKAISKKIRLGFWNTVIKGPSLKKVKKDFGTLNVEQNLCTQCGICDDKCDYEAIKSSPYPIFNKDNCHACYSCFNNCPTGAISTETIDSDYAFKGSTLDSF